MKIRHGFVSNSSSSSFVVAKIFLTNEQIAAIHDWHAEMAKDHEYWANDEGYLSEDENYISCNIYNVDEEFDNLCKIYGIDQKKMIFLEH